MNMSERRALILTRGPTWDYDVSVMHDATITIERESGFLPAWIWGIIIDCAINQRGQYISWWKCEVFSSGVKEEFSGRRPVKKTDRRSHWHRHGWGQKSK